MSNINTHNIKILRDKTGAGMMDCKKALVENEGDLEKAVAWLRKKGIAKAEKKSSRVASQGLVGLKIQDKYAFIIEINTETDFVSKNTDFQKFANNVLNIGINQKYTRESLLAAKYDLDNTISSALQNLIAKIGENIVIRRLEYLEDENDTSIFGSYIHNKIDENTGKMACIVKIKSPNKANDILDLANKISMHITASKPLALDENSVDSNILNYNEFYLFNFRSFYLNTKMFKLLKM